MNNNMLNDINNVIEELKKLGKDASEMELWSKLAPTMAEEEQEKLLKNLKEELELIKS
jgi:chaperonin cofactor prefoldin